jgi:AcrR family transcriptional regulator
VTNPFQTRFRKLSPLSAEIAVAGVAGDTAERIRSHILDLADQGTRAALLDLGWAPVKPDAIFRTVREQDAAIRGLQGRIKDQRPEIEAIRTDAKAILEAAKAQAGELLDAVLAVLFALRAIPLDQPAEAREAVDAICKAIIAAKE